MSNTKLTYMYRSASNFKISRQVVCEGADATLIPAIHGALDEGEWFIPSQVGLDNLQGDQGWELDRDEDSVWHEIVEVEATDLPTTPNAPTFADLAAAFAARANAWDEDAAIQDLFPD